MIGSRYLYWTRGASWNSLLISSSCASFMSMFSAALNGLNASWQGMLARSTGVSQSKKAHSHAKLSGANAYSERNIGLSLLTDRNLASKCIVSLE